MISNIHLKRISAGLVVASAIALYALTTPVDAQSSGALDYEFFKTKIEPIFLKSRAEHARCYVCHQKSRHSGLRPSGALNLEQLSPGNDFWTEEQSRHNFQTLSQLVIPGQPLASYFLLHPLAPEAGGDANTHNGGRQFRSQDDPDWKNMKAWVMGQKAAK